MPSRKTQLSLLMVTLLLAACSGEPEAVRDDAASAAPSANALDARRIAEESARANEFFERVFDEELAASPQRQTALGIKDDYDKWDPQTDAAYDAALERAQRHLAELEREFDPEHLDRQTRLSYEVLRRDAEERIEGYRWRHYNYLLDQMRGMQSRAPSFLINLHRIADEADAEAYIARLRGLETLIDQTLEQIDIRVAQGIEPPRFAYAYVLDDAQNIISGRPFSTDGDDSPLFEDFRAKVEALELPEARAAALIRQASAALTEAVGPAYERLIDRARTLEANATDDDGVWKLPDGDDYYASRLRVTTTTDMTAGEIHQVGLDQVARIHDEMRGIMETLEFDGSLAEFFEFMRADEQFYYPDTDAGREAYLQGARDIIEAFTGRLDEAFGVAPQAEMEVRAVEPYRERSAGKAFYQRASPDGSRPGVYYANLYRMSDMPIYQKQALAYHEGIPGHHMQIAIAQELEGIPRFRRFSGIQAYTEGWGLYSEYFPVEMGFYDDPYSDFGRLAMELWRAGRLVVDTGLHALRWSRQDAIDYLVENTPNPPGDAGKAIDRYIVLPGQATAYMIGMRRILEIRERAQAALGDDFDIRDFHDAVLENGALPLDLLEEVVLERLGAAGSAVRPT